MTAINQTFDGPSGPIPGGIVGTETHQNGSLSDKLFAPGYGEFLSTDGSDIEALAGGGVRSAQVTLEWIRDRIAHTLDAVTRTRIDTLVGDLGSP